MQTLAQKEKKAEDAKVKKMTKQERKEYFRKKKQNLKTTNERRNERQPNRVKFSKEPHRDNQQKPTATTDLAK